MEFEVLCGTPPGATSKRNFPLRKTLLLMKLVLLFTIIASLQAWSKGYTQTITISVKNVSLEKVFKEIRKQSGYSFIYTKEEISIARPVSLQVKGASIEQVLGLCFSEQPLSYTIVENHIVVKKKTEEASNSVMSNLTITIKGLVVNEKKEPIEGISVKIKGTNRGSSTDVNGIFELNNVDENAVLIFSGVNVETYELEVNGKTDIVVELKTKIASLGNVQVIANTGYELVKPNEVTGSLIVIDNKRLNQQSGSNILNRLDGVASGVIFPKQNLQGRPQFMVRGLSTINGPNSPLIVVDNFPYDGDINNINPNDVESITVLKDAASASIWGVRAGNGVVVITTKKGQLNQPLKLEVNTNVIFTERPQLSNLRTISSNEYVDVEKMLFDKGYYDGYLGDTYNYAAVSPVVEILNKVRNGTISPNDGDARINAFRKDDIMQQYLKDMYQDAATQQYALNLHGGSTNMSYYLSTGYDRSTDQLGAPSNRLTIRSASSFKPVNNLQLSLSVQYAQSHSQSGKPAYGSIATGQWSIPYLQFADAGGNPSPIARNLRETYTDTAGGGKLLDWKYYPLEDYQHNITSANQQDLSANISLNYKVARSFSLDIKYLYERQTGDANTLYDPQSYYARNQINTFSQVDPSSGKVTYEVPNGGILNLSHSVLESQDLRGQVNYDHAFAKNHFVVLAGGETRQAHSTGNKTIYYGYDQNTLVNSTVDFVNPYPSYINGNYSNIPSGNDLSDQLNRYISIYANAAYTCNNKYSVSLSGRRDASNLFGVNTNNKWKPLWSAGASWFLSKESFYHIGWLPYLKLRATYGFTGNTDPFNSGVLTVFYINPQPPNNLPWTRINAIPNPDLRWEKVKIVNAGIDFKTKDEALTGTIEGYVKNGIDLIGAGQIDPTAGLNNQVAIYQNVAGMQGKGLDASFDIKAINKKFQWKATLLFSYNFSKTTKYFVDSNLRSSNFIGNGSIISPLVGKPLYSIAAFRWGGLDDMGNPRGFVGTDLSENYPVITQRTRKEDLIYKPVMPAYFGSVINMFSYSGIHLTINISYRLGYFFMKPTVSYSTLFNNGAVTGSADYAQRWQKPGDEHTTNVPSLIYPSNQSRDMLYSYSEINILKADNIKLQYADLSYDLDKISRWVNIPHAELYINASNLGMIWVANKNHIDPDFINIPKIGKSYAIGLRANF